MAADGGWTLTDDDRQLFFAEAEEMVQTLEEGALALERGGENPEMLQAMFRAAHTLKGNSGLVGEAGIAGHMHHMEALLDDLREGRVAVTPALVQQVLSGIDALREMLAQFAQGVSPTAAPQAPAVPLAEGEAPTAAIGLPRYVVQLAVDPSCAMPAVRVFQAYQALSRLGLVERTDPPQDGLARFEGRSATVIVRLQRPDDVKEALADVDEIQLESVQAESVVAAAAPMAQSAEAEREAATQTVRVRVDLLDHLMNLVGELVLDRTRVADLVSRLDGGKDEQSEEVRQELSRSSLHLGRVTLDLQETIMKARMLPIEHLFRRFPRLVRDLAAKSGKRIALDIYGQDTELDRMVMDELGDPLTHILRNSVDHGIEPPEKRLAAGKTEEGHIILRASTEEGYVVVDVVDDGDGIDAEAVKRTALRRGVLTPEQAERMTMREAQELIFAPGFSTSEEVTEISGRGVGLDAVRASLERLSGVVDLVTEAGKGTTFRLRIPLTLAIMRALMVRTGDSVYALPLGAVRQIVRLNAQNVQVAHGRPLLADRGELIGLLSLAEIYGEPGRQDETFAVVVGAGERQVALKVGALLGEQEIVLKAFGDFLGAVPGLTGATILGNGELALVADVRYFLRGKEAS
ncbi:MAG: chemotaxis protein CheA [Thermaerobacter sp.]|nr:chemotaxis protein CheA [Thermaerobacter sp.]